MTQMAYTALLLAGGQSRRMGQSKALLPWKGGTVVEHIMQIVAPLVSSGSIVGTDTLPLPRGWTAQIDTHPQQGPVGGLATALSRISTPYALVLSCDLPLLTEAALRYLMDHHLPKKNAIFVTPNNCWQPLIGLYDRQAGQQFEAALAHGKRRLQRVVASLPLQLVPCPVQYVTALTNINTPEEYQHVYAAHH